MIPAYNASGTISDLVKKLSGQIPVQNVIIVNDGSADSTGELASKTGATVLEHKVNRGKGEALKTGFAYALAQGFDYVVTMDADLQHRPEELSGFIRKIDSDSIGILVGTRSFGFKNMPFDRVLTNFTTSVILSFLSGQTIKDSQSGYRSISCQILKDIKLKSRRYDLESEILIKAGRRGYSIGQVPISTVYAGSRSFINPIVDTGRFIRICWKSLFW